MIYIIIGQSGSGKTTFCKENLLKPPYSVLEDITKITACENNVFGIGAYGVGRRCEGTDTLPYDSQKKIIEQVKKLSKNHDVVLEGDRITSKAVFDEISRIKCSKKLYLVTCTIRTSMERLRRSGSRITVQFVKATKTKTRRLYMEFGDKFHGEIINTEGK